MLSEADYWSVEMETKPEDSFPDSGTFSYELDEEEYSIKVRETDSETYEITAREEFFSEVLDGRDAVWKYGERTPVSEEDSFFGNVLAGQIEPATEEYVDSALEESSSQQLAADGSGHTQEDEGETMKEVSHTHPYNGSEEDPRQGAFERNPSGWERGPADGIERNF